MERKARQPGTAAPRTTTSRRPTRIPTGLQQHGARCTVHVGGLTRYSDVMHHAAYERELARIFGQFGTVVSTQARVRSTVQNGVKKVSWALVSFGLPRHARAAVDGAPRLENGWVVKLLSEQKAKESTGAMASACKMAQTRDQRQGRCTTFWKQFLHGAIDMDHSQIVSTRSVGLRRRSLCPVKTCCWRLRELNVASLAGWPADAARPI